MLGRILPIVLLAAAGYWYWTGPYQESKNPAYEQRLQENRLKMDRCLRGKAYAAGATGQVSGNPEDACAQQYNLYRYEGQWHSYDDVRPD